MGVIPVPRHWDPENLIVYYTTFSIKSWIPVSSTGMTSQGHWNFCFNICTLAMHLNRYIISIEIVYQRSFHSEGNLCQKAE
nr:MULTISPECIES: WPE palindromic element domain-containing protein [unclassified Wolbachia]